MTSNLLQIIVKAIDDRKKLRPQPAKLSSDVKKLASSLLAHLKATATPPVATLPDSITLDQAKSLLRISSTDEVTKALSSRGYRLVVKWTGSGSTPTFLKNKS